MRIQRKRLKKTKPALSDSIFYMVVPNKIRQRAQLRLWDNDTN